MHCISISNRETFQTDGYRNRVTACIIPLRLINVHWDTKKAKLYTYATRSKSKAMENKIEALELQNQDLKREINVTITAMANHSTTRHAQASNTIGPPPHAVRDPPYGWNTEDPVNKEQEQLKVKVQHQALRTTQPFVVHRKTPQTEDKWQSLEEQLRVVEGGNRFGLEVVDLCLIPDVDLLTDFETPKFNKYKGFSCPRVHLAIYCRKMVAYIYNDKIPIHCFQDSLTRAPLNW
ncbi:hypothetical protein CR513_09946, partial [Mucuna pruriens]